MVSFLEKVSKYIIEKHGDKLGNICIVLPNRRAKLFIQKHISAIVNKTIWVPQIYAIEDFIIKLSDLQIADNLDLYIELYETYKSIDKEKPDTFEEFIGWAKTLIQDFNDIDLNLADPKEIFSFLTEAKSIALWNPGKTELTENQKKYIRFYNRLYDYYLNFSEKLLAKKAVYPGLAYRQLAENIDTIIKAISWDKIYFAGLNALTLSEEKIIKELIEQERAEILWDADKYYTENQKQEAGNFIRYYSSKWNLKNIKWIDDNYSQAKNINITGIPKQTGQVKYAGQLVSELFKQDKESIKKTAIVLADENLLIPLLNSMPSEIKDFNVTMGLPLKYVPVYDLFNSIFVMHANADKLRKVNDKKQYRFYYKDVIKILEHPLLNNSLKFKVQSLKFKRSKKIFYNFDDIQQIVISQQSSDKSQQLNPNIKLQSTNYELMLMPFFYNSHDKPAAIPEYFSTLIDILREQRQTVNEQRATSNEQRFDIELEYLYSFAKIINRLKTVSSQLSDLNLKSVHTLFKQLTESSSIPFYGEPLKGLQIMGLLETRTLDFENIIMLSVNENLIPSAKTNNSFIPFDIRKEFILPTYRDKDSIYAYHFYRLLQRVKNINLIYNTENDEFGKGEKSRFITQIMHELPVYNPNIKIQNNILSIPPSKDDRIKPIVIKKTDKIIEQLYTKAEKSYSPSALNVYRNCSLQFYFKYILGLEEAEQAEETIEADTLGTVIHHVLKKLYEPYINKTISKDDFIQMLPKIGAFAEEAFNEYYKEGDISYGKNLLIVKVANKFISNFIKSEIEFVSENSTELNIISLEQSVDNIISIDVPKADKLEVKLHGIIDRIDSIGKTIRIVDYKTGFINPAELKIKEWDALLDDKTLNKCFQVLMYSWLYLNSSEYYELRTTNYELILVPGLISFRQLSKGLQKVGFPNKEETFNYALSQQIEAIIKQILSDIYNKDLPFIQTDDREICSYCSYKEICIR